MNRIIFIAVLSLFSLCAFSQTKQNNNLTTTIEVDIPFIVAKNYFVKNTFKKAHFPKAKITTKKEFDSMFGAASYMGEDGKVTPIDFKKQYVIAVIEKETNVNTIINPESLISKQNKIILTCKTTYSEKQSSTMRPFLLIVVDKKYKGIVTLYNSSITAEIPIRDGLSLDNNQWIIEHFNNPKKKVSLKNSYIRIDEKMNSFSGNDGCNMINGKVNVDKNAITFSNIVGTQMACENMEEGILFINNLIKVNKYEIKGGELFLYLDKQLIMTLESLK